MSSHRVLVVEDEGLIARDIQNRLEAMGHQVIGTADTAEEALERASDADIVLMDIRLDGRVDGIDAAAAIREKFHLPVVFLTAHADRSTLERAKSAAPFGYLVKPLAQNSLQTALDVAVQRHAAERQLEEREARLRESESWLRTVLTSVAEAVVVTDARGRSRMFNQQAEILFGGAPGDLTRWFPSDPVALAILRDEAVAVEGEIRGRAVEGSAAPVRVPTSGSTAGVVLTLRDVTARRTQEDQLIETEKITTASRLAAGVALEYSPHLAVLRKGTGLLREQFTGATRGPHPPVRDTLKEMDLALGQASELTDRLTGLGAPRPGASEIVNLNALVRRAPKLVEAIAGAKVSCVIHPDRAAGKIHADPQHIEQMLMNLIIYACAMITDGSELSLSTEAASGKVLLRLAYRAALAAVKQEDRPDANRDPMEIENLDAHNIGLSIARGIAAAQGGHLAIEGNVITVGLPEWRETAVVPCPGDLTQTILLVEPRDKIRAELHNYFEAHGYNLLEASDWPEAAALLELHEGRLELVVAAKELEVEAGEVAAVPLLIVEPSVTRQLLLRQVREKLEPFTYSASAS